MARTILMIHGYGATGGCWAPAAQRLKAEGYVVETPTLRADQRKTDASGAGLAGVSLADYIADMSALAASLAKRDGEAPIVFGHSMGGLIAQKLAEAGLVSGAVLFSPASPADARGKPKLSPVFTFLNAVLMSKPETKTVKIWKTGFKWGVLNAVPTDRHDAIYATVVHDSGRALADLAWPDKDPNKAVHVDVGKVKVPLLIVAGAMDRTTPIEDLRLVGQKYSAIGGDYVEYPGHAHWVIDEPGSDVVLGDVIGWLNTKSLTATAPAPAMVAKAEPAAPKVEPPVATAPAPKAAVKPPAKPKAPAKVLASAAAPPAAPRTVAAKPASAAKAVAEPAASKTPAPVTVAPAKAAEPKAKPAAAKPKPAPKASPAKVATPAAKAPTKAAAKTAAPKPPAAAKPAPKPKPVAVKAPAASTTPAATKTPAKSSPKPKKSV